LEKNRAEEFRVKKKILFLLFCLALAVAFLARRFDIMELRPKQPVKESSPKESSPKESSPKESSPDQSQIKSIEQEMAAQLNENISSSRTLAIPKPVHVKSQPAPAPRPVKLDARAVGRKKRETLPMGIVLWDNVPVFKDGGSPQVLYTMQTGDFVRVYSEENEGPRFHVHPGLDVYLALTSRDRRASGDRLPDQPGWIGKENLQIFEADQAKLYTESAEPITLGRDPSFSTLSFYERAMKNPDVVVHRVVGPRLVSILGIHDDYLPSWRTLYRDADPKMRSVTLAALRERGVGNSRPIIEDLIRRLSELTQTRAEGETEAEVLAILSILKESGHPRVHAAMESFADSWRDTQTDRVVQALEDLLTSAP